MTQTDGRLGFCVGLAEYSGVQVSSSSTTGTGGLLGVSSFFLDT